MNVSPHPNPKNNPGDNPQTNEYGESPYKWWMTLLALPVLVILFPYYLLRGIVRLLVIAVRLLLRAIEKIRTRFVIRFHFYQHLKQAGRYLSWGQACSRIQKEGGTLLNGVWWTPDDVISLSPFPPHSERENREIEFFGKMVRAENDLKVCFDWDRWCAQQYISRRSGKAYYIKTWKIRNKEKKLTKRFSTLKAVKVWNPRLFPCLSTVEEPTPDGPDFQSMYWDDSTYKSDQPEPWYLHRKFFSCIAIPVMCIGAVGSVAAFLLINCFSLLVFYPILLIRYVLLFIVKRLTEFRLRRQMKRKSRLIRPEEAFKLAQAEGGTLIMEPRSDSEVHSRLWWTPDDVISNSPFQPMEQSQHNRFCSALLFDENPPDFEWENWCWENYISPDTGRAKLISKWNCEMLFSKLEKLQPKLTIVGLALHQPSYRKRLAKKYNKETQKS